MPDGSRIFVANLWDDNITVVDSASSTVLRTLPAGWEPTSVVTDPVGKYLYVANRLSDDVSVIDLSTSHEMKRIPAGRGASYLARAGNTPFIYSSHVYPNMKGGVRRAPESQSYRMRADTVYLDPMAMVVADTVPQTEGTWLFHCHVNEHLVGGMAALFRVAP